MNTPSESPSDGGSAASVSLTTDRMLQGDLLQTQIDYFRGMKDIHHFLDVVSESVLVINEYLQVIYANRAFLKFCGQEAFKIYGRRLGDIVNCEFCEIETEGCGYSEYCKFCDAMNTVLNTQQTGMMETHPCSISLKGWESMEFILQAAPYQTEIGQFIYLSLRDISDQHRRETLERIFLHDILNTAGGMRGLAEMLDEGKDVSNLREYVIHCTSELVEEIETQRLILSAETGQLKIYKQLVNSETIFRSMKNRFLNHEVARGKKLSTHYDDEPFSFLSDSTLLKRILSNMIKNAFEASAEGEIVSLTAQKKGGRVIFEVHNSAVMSHEVQMNLFKRTFSTKGRSRGLGTYSIRLLGEKYLGGKVSFDSGPGLGTTFRIILPQRTR